MLVVLDLYKHFGLVVWPNELLLLADQIVAIGIRVEYIPAGFGTKCYTNKFGASHLRNLTLSGNSGLHSDLNI